MNLYKITLVNYKEFYVIATDPSSAAYKLKTVLDKEDLFFTSERQFKTIEFIGANFGIEDDDKSVFEIEEMIP